MVSHQRAGMCQSAKSPQGQRTVPSHVRSRPAGSPPYGSCPFMFGLLGADRRPAKDTHPVWSARWNQMSLFQGAVLVWVGGPRPHPPIDGDDLVAGSTVDLSRVRKWRRHDAGPQRG